MSKKWPKLERLTSLEGVSIYPRDHANFRRAAPTEVALLEQLNALINDYNATRNDPQPEDLEIRQSRGEFIF